MFNKKRMAKWLANELMNENQRKSRQKRRQAMKLEKKRYKEQMINLVGKTRWHLSWWLGTWVFFVGKPRRES